MPTTAAGEWLDILIVDLALEDSPLLAGVFAEIVDAKSAFTAQHSHRVAALAGAMSRLAGAGAQETEAVLLAGLLHDLGKLGVSNLILDKPAALDDTEWLAMRRHPSDSARVLQMIPGWAAITSWAASHHERPDGRGYHLRREGETIPTVGRWLAAADAFDAMTADRPYRQGREPAEALRRLQEGRGTQCDPQDVLLLTAIVEGYPLPQPARASTEQPALPQSAPPIVADQGHHPIRILDDTTSLDSPFPTAPIGPISSRYHGIV